MLAICSEFEYLENLLRTLNFRTIQFDPDLLFARREDVDWVVMVKSGNGGQLKASKI